MMRAPLSALHDLVAERRAKGGSTHRGVGAVSEIRADKYDARFGALRLKSRDGATIAVEPSPHVGQGAGQGGGAYANVHDHRGLTKTCLCVNYFCAAASKSSGAGDGAA